MLTLTVTRRNGVALSAGPGAMFGPDGGTIGRADTNQLVLEDPERTVSRIHAQISALGDAFVLLNRGSNPLLFNGAPINPGQQTPVADGDEVQIGGYQLRASLSTDVNPRGAHPPPLSHEHAQPAHDPFADLLAGAAPVAQPAADPLDNLLRPAAPAAEPTAAFLLPDDLDLNAPQLAGSIDELFGLRETATDVHSAKGPRSEPNSGELLGGPFGEPLSAPNTAQSSDPFASLCGATPANAPPAPMRDDSPELNCTFRPPRELHEAAAATLADVMPPQVNADPPAARPATQSDPIRDPLRDAFLRGLNIDDPKLTHLTPELLERIGALLREATEGTLDLLVARAATRRELHASVTVITPHENNPLKFSPNTQAALGHLLHAPIRGFMDGPAAFTDAYADLRAHQIGYVAGVKAALEGLCQRFSPQTLEARLTPATLRDSLLPGARRARCWDAFVELYDEIAHEAVDNFHTMLNEAFVEAYDRQVERLRPRK